MKAFKYFFALITFVIIVSCSKEDEPQIEESLIVGEWNLEEYNYSGVNTSTQGGSSMTITYTGDFYDLDVRLFLNSDNTYNAEGSYIVKVTSTVEGETFVQDIPFNNIATTGTYRIEGNKLFLEGNNQPQQQGNFDLEVSEGTIVELTKNKMVLVYDQDFITEMEGAQVEISVQGQQIFSR